VLKKLSQASAYKLLNELILEKSYWSYLGFPLKMPVSLVFTVGKLG
jgi:hypothetical protein